MCLQNYLIFYLEVIPPLSSFIALYMTEAAERHPMRPSQLPSAGSVYGPSSGRQHRPQGPPHFSPSSLPPRRPFPRGGRRGFPTGSVFCIILPNVNFILFPSDREAPFREAVISELVANATLAKAGAPTLPGPRLRLGAFAVEGLVL